MFKYKISIDYEALNDIQSATDWYNEQADGLGTRFQKQVKTQINFLKSNPFTYASRYNNVRCMIISEFAFNFLQRIKRIVAPFGQYKTTAEYFK